MFHKEGTATGGGGGGGNNSSRGTNNNSRGRGGSSGGTCNHKAGGGSKHSSSSSSSSTLDVPLRKSDRRRLRSRFVELYLPQLLLAAEAKAEAAAEDGNKHSQEVRRLNSLLDSIFTDPTVELSARRLRPARITVYLRSASSAAAAAAATCSNGTGNNGNDDAENGSSTTARWPYVIPVPVVFEVEHSDSRRMSLVPSLATLSVLSPSNLWRLPNVVVNSYTSKFLCRGADLMRGGMSEANVREVLETMKERRRQREEVASGTSSSSGGVGGGNKHKPKPRAKGSVSSGIPAEEAVVAVRVASNPQPFAVGWLHPELLPGAETGNNTAATAAPAAVEVGEGCRGVGVSVLTCFGDDWTREMRREIAELGGGVPSSEKAADRSTGTGTSTGSSSSPYGGSYDDGCYGNVGFVEEGKDRYVLGLRRSDEGNDESVESEDDDENVAAGVASLKVTDEGDPCVNQGLDGGDDHDVGPSNDEGDNDNKDADDDENDGSEQAQDPTAFQSNILLLSFQRACVNLSASSLPMPISTFYANHVLKSRPEDTMLDIKATKWKKFGPFLNEQASLGIVSIKDNQVLTAVNKGHIALRDARKEKKKEQEAGNGRTSTSGKTRMAIVALNIVPARIVSALSLPPDLVMAAEAKAEERRGTGYLTKPEVRACLEWYIHEQGLDDGAGDDIRLDGNLCDILYGKSKKERFASPSNKTDFPERCSRKIAHEIFQKQKLDDAYALVSMPGNKIIKLERGKPPKINIEVATVRGRKHKCVTFVRHLEDYGINPTHFANDVSKRFATSATISEDPTSNSRAALKRKGLVEISFQGHLAEELKMLLTGGAEGRSGHGGAKGGIYKLPKGCIDIELKKNVPGKRKG